MKYLNKIDNENICVDSILVDDAEASTQETVDAFISLLGLSGKYVVADENYIGGSYNQEIGKLVHMKPFSSWTLDGDGVWNPPVPHPRIEGVSHVWDEPSLQWIVVPEVPSP
jgi:hypothetical protein